MKKKIYMTILTIITVLCIIVGCGIHLYGWEDGFLLTGGRGSGNKADDVDLSEFHSMKADLRVCNLTIEQGQRYGISYDCNEELEPEIDVRDGVLILSQKKKKIWKMINNQNCNITVTVPADTQLERFLAETDVGDLDIRQMEIQYFDAQIDVGQLDISDCTLGNVSIESDTGDIHLGACIFDDLDIDSDLGTIKVNSKRSLKDYSMDLNTDLGNISVNGEEEKREYSNQGNRDKRITIDVDCGDIEITE